MQTFTISFVYQGCRYDAECIAKARESGIEYFIVPNSQELLACFGTTVIWKQPNDIHRHRRDQLLDPEYNIAVTGGLFQYFSSRA